MISEQQKETVEQPTEVRATQARQGVGGLGVRYMLGGGLALVVIAFAIIYFTNFW